MPEESFKEKRIKSILQLYYSKPEIQKALFEFSKNREIAPSYMMEHFGKRPDTFQYPGDIFEMVKKGATSFHCSEELWKDPMEISLDMPQEKINELRVGWDFIIDIDSKYIDYSKIMAELIINMLEFHGVKNIGIKFSGSKGFHIIVPWKAFPKKVNENETSDMFPEYPRIITKYIMAKTRDQLIEKISDLTRPSKYVKDYRAPKEVMPDLVLVAPRHLFRMPYSLHEKTALASVVLNPKEIKDFELKHADPLKVKVKNFIPDVKEGEASELLMQALDWHKEHDIKEEKTIQEYKPIKISNLSDDFFPPCIKSILKGLRDGRQRSIFVLMNLFRSLGMDKEEVEKRLYDWNEKNHPPLKKGIIKSQLIANYRRKKPLMPPNCKEYYQNIGVCAPNETCKLIKNPVNYIIRKNFISNRKNSNKFKKKN
jgi:hypothetical protein